MFRMMYVIFRMMFVIFDREPWPLDGMTFETLKEQHAKRSPEDLEIDYEDLMKLQTVDAPYEEVDPAIYDSEVTETDTLDDTDKDDELKEEEAEGETVRADLGGGWGRIIYPPMRRGRHVAMDVCWSTKRDGSEGSFDRVVVTQSKNPDLHHQAKRSFWGDLWPC
ncbi:probable S-adenosyl-L-methionine-dependent RNA methyltransferase RSM22, mitochondrial isoform X1 [Carica papaya]|uniref:probable S-adenosyl-L-methionine-dependent RNA methyltransferase RSM22, mitochondrial isoform X1 n=1 Tax=Carica papaya TaxID=3649 RepID=UPI000B8C7C23|nr:probable S-adenosyl-L-methionine-dependent RNA methyltransferase RSM22, mitochondrial isoform X1 [Carica papaya]